MDATATQQMDENLDASNPDLHEGRPSTIVVGESVVVLCHARHVYTSIKTREWAGSAVEAQVADPGFTVRCTGTIRARQ